MNIRSVTALLMAVGIVVCAVLTSCKRSPGSTADILAPDDETSEAAQLVLDANADLKKIKVLYENNEGKRDELKKAMETNDTAKVKKIADDVVYLINDGSENGKSAVDKIE